MGCILGTLPLILYNFLLGLIQETVLFLENDSKETFFQSFITNIKRAGPPTMKVPMMLLKDQQLPKNDIIINHFSGMEFLLSATSQSF